MANAVNIPVRALGDGARHPVEFMSLLRLKAEGGRSVPLTREVKRLARLGWVTIHRGRAYQRKWTDIWPQGTKSCVRVKPEEIPDNTRKARAFIHTLASEYLHEVQAITARKESARPKRGARPTVKPGSPHKGGVAHSLCMQLLGMSLGWCSAQRKAATRFGYAIWARRFADMPLVPFKAMAGRQRLKPGDETMATEEVASLFAPTVAHRVWVPRRERRKVS